MNRLSSLFPLAALRRHALLLALLLAAPLFALTSGNFTYEVSNGEATITDFPSSYSGALTIPSRLGGYPVRSIGNQAFWYCSSLTSVVIPASVTSIGNYAFSGCSTLRSVTIPESVTTIGREAFCDCSSLTSVTIPEGVTSIGYRAFEGCSALPSVTIPASVTSIAGSAFYGCRSLTSVVIPASVTYIGYGAFSGCDSLPIDENGIQYESQEKKVLIKAPESLAGEFTIPASVKFVHSEAFYGCGSLTSVVIPEGVTYIGGCVFQNCSSLTSVTMPASVTVIGGYAFQNCSSLTSLEIPASVTSIGEGAFSSCSSLTSVTIPEGVTAIGDYAFAGCSAQTSVTIPASVTSIGYEAFEGVAPAILVAAGVPNGMLTTNLTSVTIPEGVTSIGEGAFKGCSSLTSVTIPASVTSIGYRAFEGVAPATLVATAVPSGMSKTNLTTLVIPEGVTSIGASAFEGCGALTSVVIPASVTSIGDGAFAGVAPATLVAAAVPSGMSRTNLTSVTIPEGVTSIGASAFEDCGALTSVTIPEGVTSIGDGAFKGCDSLPTDVNGIRYESQEKKVLIKAPETLAGEFTIPASVKFVHATAFSGCSSLTSVVIPEGVTSIGDYAFEGCDSLPKDENGIQYESQEKKVLIKAPESLTGEFTIPASVKFVHNTAFSGCSSLTSAKISEGVTSIGKGAFQGCSSLTSVVIPASVTSIGDGAFEGVAPVTLVAAAVPDGMSTENLISVTIPESVTTIGDRAFYGCSSLTSVTIPASVTTIGDGAFEGVEPEMLIASRFPVGAGMSAEKLTTVIVPEGTKSIVAEAFAGCSALTSVTIPSSVTEIGEGAFTGVAPERLVAPFLPSGMSTAKLTEVTLTTAATVIAEEAFAGNTVLQSIVLPAGVTSIGARAFAGCSALERVTIPSSVTEIGAGAFRECTGLTEVVFAEGLTKIGDEAFWGCSAVEEMVLPASVTELGKRVFTGCNRVLVAEGNRNYKSVDGVLFSANNEWLLHFPVYQGGEYATPVNVHFIGEEAFMGNTALTQVYLADITTLEPRAFKDCSGLLSCFATEGLLTIQANAFENATELRAFSVPASVSRLEEGAFKNCPKLNLIAFRGTVPMRTGTVFSGMLLDQTRSTYPEEYAASWEAALDGSLMWDGLKMVADYYYDGTDGNYQYRVYGGEATITGTTVSLAGEVRLPMTLDGYLVTGIGAQAFVKSTGLTAITFPKSLLSIGDNAFFFCKKLQSVTFEGRPMTKGTAPTQPFPANTTAIGNYPAELESAWSKVIQAGYYYGLRMGLVKVQISLDGEGEVRGAGTYHIDEAVTLEAIPAKGHRFVEWAFLDGTTSTENPITFTATKACYVMATFEADPTAIVFSNITYENLMGATHRNPATYEEGTEYVFTTPSEVTGYTFQGWQPAAIDSSMTGDQTIRATWRANGYTVVYAANGGMGSMDHTAAVYDVPFSLRTNAFTFSGRRFCGWALTADGPVTYADSAEVRNLTAVSEGVVTLYAIWEKMPFLPGDSTATIEGSAEAGWTVKPSGGVGEVVVSIPEGVEAAKVTVEVPSTVKSVTANGATIKVVKVEGETRHDITNFLDFTKAGEGTIDLSKVDVQAQIAEAILDMTGEEGASFDPSAEQPLTTAETKPGLTYTLLEGDSLDNLKAGDSKVGDGQPWQPQVTKRGSSAFYRIRVSK